MKITQNYDYPKIKFKHPLKHAGDISFPNYIETFLLAYIEINYGHKCKHTFLISNCKLLKVVNFVGQKRIKKADLWQDINLLHSRILDPSIQRFGFLIQPFENLRFAQFTTLKYDGIASIHHMCCGIPVYQVSISVNFPLYEYFYQFLENFRIFVPDLHIFLLFLPIFSYLKRGSPIVPNSTQVVNNFFV